MDARPVRSRRSCRQVSREMRGLHGRLGPQCPHPSTAGTCGHRDCGTEDCLRVEWARACVAGEAVRTMGSRRPKPLGVSIRLFPEGCGESTAGGGSHLGQWQGLISAV